MILGSLINAIKENQLLAAGLGVGGAGIISFWLRDIPKAIIRFLKRELTTNLVITSSHPIYYSVLKLIEYKYKNSNFRSIKVSNGRFGEDKAMISIGYGAHYIKYNKNILFIQLNKDASNQSKDDKEYISITKLGRDRNIFNTLISESISMNESRNVDITEVFRLDDGYMGWRFAREIKKRNFTSIFIGKKDKDKIINGLSDFLKREQWYLDKGIPYQYGILLYGPPGTGKTSIIKSIASYLNFPIYYLSPKKLHRIEMAMSTIPDNCIVVIEDIDSNRSTHSRNSINKIHKNNNEDSTISNDEKSLDKDIFNISDLSEILNSIDGLFSPHGRILIATTNCIEDLDLALIRPGRIDLQIEIGYVNNEILQDFIDSFYPYNNINCSHIILKPNITIATLQNMFLMNNTAEEIIESVKLLGGNINV